MSTNNNPISVTYSDSKLRILVEEYITMQKHEFIFKSLCSFVLYRAMEEGTPQKKTMAFTRATNWSRKIEKELVLFWRRLLMRVE